MQGWESREDCSKPSWYLLHFGVFNSTKFYWGLLCKASFQKTKWRWILGHSLKTAILKYFPWEIQGEKEGGNSGRRTWQRPRTTQQRPVPAYGNHDGAALSKVRRASGYFTWESTAEGNIGEQMVPPRKPWHFWQGLAASQTASFPYIWPENSYCVPLSIVDGGGMKVLTQLHTDWIGYLSFWKDKTPK